MPDTIFTPVGSRQKQLVDRGNETFAEVSVLPILMPSAWTRISEVLDSRFTKSPLEHNPTGWNRGGFPRRWKSDSCCLLDTEASRHGETDIRGFTVAGDRGR